MQIPTNKYFKELLKQDGKLFPPSNSRIICQMEFIILFYNSQYLKAKFPFQRFVPLVHILKFCVQEVNFL